MTMTMPELTEVEGKLSNARKELHDLFAEAKNNQGELDHTKVKGYANGTELAEFVRAKPKGLEEPVAQGGTNVSGGQRQRLCIARALAADPQVYLFDDSFSALDVTTDALLREALADATEGATVIIVAQRISTIRTADHIVVLDGGKVVGEGTHDELLESNATYREIVESQMSIEGVA